ncbi:YjbF family lipoprotein [Paenirhodobacter sp. CAU 1674]|uniref:YjbF family lipoprotein n=1 Tax=Paenirhodobacter sp. CAU 1674 TaxID=3032596 RepID=UPI0023DBCD1E|nr:YjbF family lipoprotein [Paenirhodobacter sp. CAU 1674]MDF2143181.1 YjbF family lipoprotein [Paenirhodobacter sp. CAU 1674]
MHALSRLLICALCAAPLLGCSSDPQTQKQLSALPLMRKSAPEPAAGFLAAHKAGAPAVIAVQENRPEVIAVFLRQALSDRSGVGTWITADGSQLMFEDGIVVGTRGFGADLMASDVSDVLPLVQGMGDGIATHLMTQIDGDDHAVTRAFKCRISRAGIDSVVIGTTLVSTQTMVEDCRGSDTSFANYYWVVPATGEIVQSSQWAGPLIERVSVRKIIIPAEQ